MNENTRFIYIHREISIVNENTRFLIYIERDFYSERKYKILYIYRERFTIVNENARFLIYI